MKLSQRRMSRPSLGGMLATRQGALILAVLCAACAAGILVIALSSYKRNVQTTVQQATVLIATGEIHKGTSGAVISSEKLYKPTPVVASQLAPGAISDASELDGKIAQADILPGQQLSLAEFGTTIVPTSILTPNQRALSIPADEVHADLALLQPGDRIDLYEEFGKSGVSGGAAAGGVEVGLMIPNVLVLKTPSSGLAGAASSASSNTSGSSSSASSGGGSSSSSLVLAINSAQVPSVALTADNGQLWLALRPAQASKSAGGILTVPQLVAQAESLGTTPSIVPSPSGKSIHKTPGGHP